MDSEYDGTNRFTSPTHLVLRSSSTYIKERVFHRNGDNNNNSKNELKREAVR
jgi:hypothetical protein